MLSKAIFKSYILQCIIAMIWGLVRLRHRNKRLQAWEVHGWGNINTCARVVHASLAQRLQPLFGASHIDVQGFTSGLMDFLLRLMQTTKGVLCQMLKAVTKPHYLMVCDGNGSDKQLLKDDWLKKIKCKCVCVDTIDKTFASGSVLCLSSNRVKMIYGHEPMSAKETPTM